MPETYTGTVDRIVDGETAVILLEDDGETVEQLDIHVSELPEEVSQEGMVIEVRIEDDEVVSITPKPDEMRDRLERNRERLERLGTRLSERDGE